MIYSYKKSSFDELPNKDGTVSINHQNILKVGMEMFKVVKDGNPELVNEIFRVSNVRFYELLQRTLIHISLINTVVSVAETIKFFRPKIWDLIPNEIKCLENLKDLKTTITNGNQNHVHVEFAKHISMLLVFYNM